MKPGITALERAFALARSGKYATLTDLKSAVSKEGYLADQLEGRMLARQLREILKAHRPAKP
ncbi:hypothetical protein [Devosia elaeis]|jgi:hypothetical protein|uniref:Uncharacterized protein n=1 Tax=Devosia elaeis TaxID=1770058 RepID=A0A178HVT2_9HYPH|nr:hypothetical protein [Devosia elaeis]OAM76789.1 hypothetical protein A3840_11540 [Devosia elaeis]